MSWALIRHKSPHSGSNMPPVWHFCPQLGPSLDTSPIYADGETISMIDGSVIGPGDPLGIPGTPGWAFVRQSDMLMAQDMTFRAHPGPDGTIHLATLSSESVGPYLTAEMRADLLDILGPLSEEEKNR